MPSIFHEIKIAHPPNTEQSGEGSTSPAADRSQAVLKHAKKQLKYFNLFSSCVMAEHQFPFHYE